MLRRLWAAVGFLTVLPLPAFCQHTEQDLVRSVSLFPVIGLLVGLSSAGLALGLASLFPPLVLAVILVGWLAVVHGGLHLDGVADTADGFLSHHGRDRVLDIMRDSHIGAFGSLAMGGVLALKVAALASLPPAYYLEAVLLAPVLGRCVMVPMLGFLSFARSDGLGLLFLREGPGWRPILESTLAMTILVGTAWLTVGIAGLVAGAVVVMVTALFAYWCRRRIGGITGDTVGAASEIAEMVVLVTLSVQFGG